MLHHKVVVVFRWVFGVCYMLTVIGVFFTDSPEAGDGNPYTATRAETRLSEFSRLIYESQNHQNWIVINIPRNQTTINLSMKEVVGWRIVITGIDDVVHTFCRMPSCVFLSPDVIRQLRKHYILGVEPDDLHYYGYIYAIKHGAKNILTVSSDVHYLGNLDFFSFKHKVSGIVYNESRVFDPEMFSKNLTQRRQRSTNVEEKFPFEFTLKDEMYPAIQVPLYKCKQFTYTNNTIDFIPTHPSNRQELPPLYVGSGHYSKLASPTVVLFRYEAFWALLWNVFSEHTTTSFMLLIQKLLHELDFHISFIPFQPCLVKNTTTRDLDISVDLKLVEFLNKNQCKDLRLSECFSRIAREMTSVGYLTKSQLDELIKWINILGYLNYKWPPMTKLLKSLEAETDIPMFLSTNIYSDIYQESLQNYSQGIIDVTRADYVCPQLNLNWYDSVIDDVMLIVTFNEFKYYKNILYLELMYRRYFRYILFCGPFPEEFLKIVHDNPQLGTFFYVQGLSEGWYYMYECTQYAMMMNFRVKGFLQIGDDTLANAWNMFRLPRDQIILPNLVDVYNRTSPKARWFWWNLDIGRAALNLVFDDFLTAVKMEDHKLAKEFLKQYKKSVMNLEYSFYRGGDLFYTPVRITERFIYVSKIAHRRHLMDEVAIPTLFMGLDDNRNIFRIRDGSLWRDFARSSYWLFFDEEKFFIHPFKLSAFFVNSTRKNFFCDTYLATSLDKLSHLEKMKNSPPFKNVGIMWNNVKGGPSFPGEYETL
ncbi:hypothetical protein LOTGIDRAFT_234291 [Lottia gigantea]|uniref:Uncharacterized protein n=1 Tax=Lottia gigantea TaxID=225164 RepID=V4A3E1_LOTGI|nr:hypothetical protein LOTGIDRAFT_234291 [Lottia gigantea]ESO89440.1 hypothetical protein LOTGIDRAFT_234291 [Lottia gigantea]